MTPGEQVPPAGPALWPCVVPAAKFGPKPTLMSLVADESVRQAVASAYGCLAIDALAAELKIIRRGDELRVTGELRADVIQPCVVSLEPVPATIREKVTFSFAPPVAPRREARAEEAEDIAYEGEDPPEPLVDGEADLGAMLLQFLALALDPYPRKAGVELSPAPDEATTHPFAALKGLRLDG
jgi:uncharacterized metal-binding protein YceD (DUF177 family)